MRHEPFGMLWHVAQIDLSVRHRRPNQQTRLAHIRRVRRVCDRGLRSRAVTGRFYARHRGGVHFRDQVTWTGLDAVT